MALTKIEKHTISSQERIISQILKGHDISRLKLELNNDMKKLQKPMNAFNKALVTQNVKLLRMEIKKRVSSSSAIKKPPVVKKSVPKKKKVVKKPTKIQHLMNTLNYSQFVSAVGISAQQYREMQETERKFKIGGIKNITSNDLRRYKLAKEEIKKHKRQKSLLRRKTSTKKKTVVRKRKK